MKSFLKILILGIMVTSFLQSGVTPTLTETTIAAKPAEVDQLATVKAGFIYVGPVGDYGWTHAHDQARQIVDDEYEWLSTVYVESIGEDIASVKTAIDNMITNDDVDIIFTTSFGFMDGTVEAAAEHDDKMFFHASGYKRSANMGTFMADFYQLYYLNGLMAGALTSTGKLGYVGAFAIPEVIRHINAFALGAKEANSTATVDVRWINSWYDPTAATNAGNALIADGVDMLAFTEDSPAVVQLAESTPDVYSFSHYSPMQAEYGATTCISGQLVHWDIIYDEILNKVHDGTYNTTNLADEDYLYFLHENAVELGGKFGEAINPLFVDDLTDTMIGTDTAYDLIMTRIDEMNDTWADVDFDPFTGPIVAQNGTTMFTAGERATIPDLFSDMMWFVDNVIGSVGDDDDGSAPVDFASVSVAFFFMGIFELIRRKKYKNI